MKSNSMHNFVGQKPPTETISTIAIAWKQEWKYSMSCMYLVIVGNFQEKQSILCYDKNFLRFLDSLFTTKFPSLPVSQIYILFWYFHFFFPSHNWVSMNHIYLNSCSCCYLLDKFFTRLFLTTLQQLIYSLFEFSNNQKFHKLFGQWMRYYWSSSALNLTCQPNNEI